VALGDVNGFLDLAIAQRARTSGANVRD